MRVMRQKEMQFVPSACPPVRPPVLPVPGLRRIHPQSDSAMVPAGNSSLWNVLCSEDFEVIADRDDGDLQELSAKSLSVRLSARPSGHGCSNNVGLFAPRVEPPAAPAPPRYVGEAGGGGAGRPCARGRREGRSRNERRRLRRRKRRRTRRRTATLTRCSNPRPPVPVRSLVPSSRRAVVWFLRWEKIHSASLGPSLPLVRQAGAGGEWEGGKRR